MILFSFTPRRSLSSHWAPLLTAFALALLSVTHSFSQLAPTFSQIVVFGDSLSDDGNIRHRAESTFGVGYPGGEFNYSDGRFTNSSDTDPASSTYVGVWHEQLARTFLALPPAGNSLDGGLNYAFGGATTIDGTSERTVISNPDPFVGGSLSITIDNLGKQIDDYLGSHPADPNALYIVWGGGNDLFDDDSAANVTATVARVTGLVNRLATAGARHLLVPNVPPLGAVPNYAGNEAEQVSLNAASAEYRGALRVALDSVVRTFAAQGVQLHVYPLDTWFNLLRILIAPAEFGFTDIVNSAQGRSSADPDTYVFWDEIHPTTAGHFQTAKEANRVLSGAVPPSGKALNISTRVSVGTGSDVSIGGFIVTGSVAKNVIVRAIGPSLSQRGVNGALADPILELRDQAGTLLDSNDNWKQTQQAEIEATTIPPENELESAIVLSLPPGEYTAIVAGKNAPAGIGLVEVYDLDAGSDAAFGNISTRGFVGVGDSAMIGGFIVGPGENPVVVVRGVGPSLTSAGIANPLLDPTIELHDGNGAVIGLNDNWRDAQDVAIKAATLAPIDDREAAFAASLPPGKYTVVLRGKADTTGTGLVEIYRIPNGVGR